MRDRFADLRRVSIAQKGPGIRGKRSHAVGKGVEIPLQHQVGWKSIFRQRDRRGRDFGQRHRAERLQRRQPGIGGGWNHRALDADRHIAAMLFREVIGGDAARPATETADRPHLPVVNTIEHDRRDPAEIGVLRLHDIQAKPRRDPGVDRVAASLQDAHRRCCRQRMPGRRHVMPPGNGRTKGW